MLTFYTKYKAVKCAYSNETNPRKYKLEYKNHGNISGALNKNKNFQLAKFLHKTSTTEISIDVSVPLTIVDSESVNKGCKCKLSFAVGGPAEVTNTQMQVYISKFGSPDNV